MSANIFVGEAIFDEPQGATGGVKLVSEMPMDPLCEVINMIKLMEVQKRHENEVDIIDGTRIWLLYQHVRFFANILKEGVEESLAEKITKRLEMMSSEESFWTTRFNKSHLRMMEKLEKMATQGYQDFPLPVNPHTLTPLENTF